ncbi:MAG: hypothetical protein J6T45_07310 [Fibrobacterales bacterium]|nr:hypothetical protein [Fibrobacterales bacterium]
MEEVVVGTLEMIRDALSQVIGNVISALIGALAALIVDSHKQRKKRIRKKQKILFDRIDGAFTAQVRDLIKNYDFHAMFDISVFEPLERIRTDAELGMIAPFNDNDLNALQAKLIDNTSTFLAALAETFVVNDNIRKVDGPEAEESAQRINDAANELWHTFREFEEKGRKVLK